LAFLLKNATRAASCKK
jgi:hypothetical protein